MSLLRDFEEFVEAGRDYPSHSGLSIEEEAQRNVDAYVHLLLDPFAEFLDLHPRFKALFCDDPVEAARYRMMADLTLWDEIVEWGNDVY